MSGGRFFLGLETGGTKAVASLLDDALKPVATREAVRPAGAVARDTIAQLAGLAKTVLAEAGVKAGEVAAVGWGFGGHVDRRRNEPAANFHEPGWGDIAAGRELAKALQAPVFVENDCKVAALAEAHLGSGRPEGLTAYITLGSGVGGGLIWNGRILASGPCGEGEIGHVTIVKHGAPCACGRRGCLEAYCSGWGVGERAMDAIRAATNRTPLMETLAAAEPRQRAEILFNAYPVDAFARGQADSFLEHLTDACTILCLLVSPHDLVFGGGIARQPWVTRELSTRLNTNLPEVMRGFTRIHASRLGALSVSYGAALYACGRLKET